MDKLGAVAADAIIGAKTALSFRSAQVEFFPFSEHRRDRFLSHILVVKTQKVAVRG